MRRRRQGNDRKVCKLCLIFNGYYEQQVVSETRCVLVVVAVCDVGVFGPRREAVIECKNVCKFCSASIELLRHFCVVS